MAQHKREEVAHRLARIEGHVHALGKMLRQDRTYPEIVQQISAVRSSLDGVVEVIVADLVEDCIRRASSGNRDSALQLKEVIARSR